MRHRPGLWRALLVLATFVACLFFFPIGSDSACINDGVWFGIELESNPAKAIRGNHPFFHVIAWPLCEAARAAGFDHPGHVAVRIVAAAGGAALAGLVAAFGGRRAARFGLAAAGFVVASRIFVIESGTGENVGPATASALAVTFAALHHRRRRLLVGSLLALALVLRQDNILLVPGVALTVFPRGKRRGPLLAFLAAAAIPVIAVYLLAWRIAAPDAGLVPWVLGLGAHGPWFGGSPTLAPFFILEAGALASALVGHHFSHQTLEALIGICGLFFPIALASSRAGFRRATCEGWLFILPVVLRFFFYGWFEPINPEWQLLPIAFSCAAAARLARLSRPGRALVVRTVLLLAAAAGVLASHVPATLTLRQTNSRDAVLAALTEAPRDAMLVVEGYGMPATLALLGLPYTMVVAPDVMTKIAAIADANPARTVLVLTDRWALDGEPASLAHRSKNRAFLDASVDDDHVHYLRYEGLVYAMLVRPRPSSRR